MEICDSGRGDQSMMDNSLELLDALIELLKAVSWPLVIFLIVIILRREMKK